MSSTYEQTEVCVDIIIISNCIKANDFCCATGNTVIWKTKRYEMKIQTFTVPNIQHFLDFIFS